MTNFIRSIPGKVLLFVLCVTSMAGLEFSVYAFLHWRNAYWGIRMAIPSVLLMIFTVSALLCVAGRKPNSEDLHPGPLHKVPFDLLLLLVIGLDAAALYPALVVFNGADSFTFLLLGLAVLFCFATGLGLLISIAGRIKTKTFWKNTLIFRLLCLCWRLLRWCFRLLRNIPLVWRTALIVLGFSILELVIVEGLGLQYDSYAGFWVLKTILLFPAALWFSLCLCKLQKGGIALAEGDLTYHVDTHRMYWDLKRHGENLNSIALGMGIAVEERLKSERMKTELITNVSHDIKTPLTSIINYAGLIAETPEKSGEYAPVLVRQSERLKRLLEDLVEASKASTGNLEVSLVPCDANILLSQTGGEYGERLSKTGLTLITKCPDKAVPILADSRRMQRIFDNLMGNICKYAQPGSRVYLTLEETENTAMITFKNMSREPLDISEEELMERFTRGDAARNTEGNGLGLSIARSLAELQRGTLHIEIDGDLFKAILTFPLLT